MISNLQIPRLKSFFKIGFNLRMHVDYLNSFISGHSAGAHVPVVQLNVIIIKILDSNKYDTEQAFILLNYFNFY